MKELAYLMFFVGCGYVLNLFANTITNKATRKIYIYYPSQAKFNLLWGFLFYTTFGWLMITSLYIKFVLSIIILGIAINLAHNYLLQKSIKNSGQGFYKKILQKKFRAQQAEDKAHNAPSTQDEILKILGLPSNTLPNSPLILSRLNLYEKLSQALNFTYASDFYKKINIIK